MHPQLRITEIFHSIQGEGLAAGLPTVFVRLTGCPLRCTYCDSEYAFYGGEKIAISSIVDEVSQYGAQSVCVTGGEPLAQPNCLLLLSALCDLGFNVSLETSGALSTEQVDPRVSVVLDFKTPDSGESTKNLYENCRFLKPNDQVKFVICSKNDYLWSKFKLDELKLADTGAEVLFSPSYQQVAPEELAKWILTDKLSVRLQIQIHKYLWGDVAGR